MLKIDDRHCGHLEAVGSWDIWHHIDNKVLNFIDIPIPVSGGKTAAIMKLESVNARHDIIVIERVGDDDPILLGV